MRGSIQCGAGSPSHRLLIRRFDALDALRFRTCATVDARIGSIHSLLGCSLANLAIPSEKPGVEPFMAFYPFGKQPKLSYIALAAKVAH
jgi:hypothetical protein